MFLSFAPDSSGEWLDFISAAVHELGHWLGLDHSTDRPSTDNRKPVMHPVLSYGEIRRTLRQDDANGLRVARPRFDILTANDSFEYTSPFWGFSLRPAPGGGGNWARYCGSGAGLTGWHGKCYVQFNGAGSSGASFYQDVHNRSYKVENLRGRVRVRNRRPSGTQKVTIAVWFLDQSPPGNVSQSCAIPNDMEWHQCFTRLFHAPGEGPLRVEVYNNSGFNVDIDTLILGDLAQLHQGGGGGGGVGPAESSPGGGPVPGIPPGVVPPAPIPGGMLPAGPGVPEDLDR